MADRFIDKTANVYADENSAFDGLHGKYHTQRINHQIAYSDHNGVSTNIAESYYSRFHRMKYGQCHRFGTHYFLITPMK